MMKPTSSTATFVPTPDSWKENLFISEDAIIERYQAEKRLGNFVLNGDYIGAKALLDSMPRGQEYYQDFATRTKDAIERQRQIALIMNSGMRMTMLSTNVPVIIIHGIATYFGRIISKATAETLFSDSLFDAILLTYCSLVQEFGCKIYNPISRKIVTYIISNIAEHLSLQQIADKFNYSTAYVNRILKRDTGCSVIQFIKQKRVTLAKALLFLDDMTIEDVSVAVGYESLSYFCRVFRQVEGTSPSEYREKILNKRAE